MESRNLGLIRALAWERTGDGRLWSIDLPAIDPALHQEIGIAVPKESRARWTYLEGTSRDRLPQLVNGLGVPLRGHEFPVGWAFLSLPPRDPQ